MYGFNSKGELVGPATQEIRIKEWVDFEDKYGVKVYIDILPRDMMNDEFKRRATAAVLEGYFFQLNDLLEDYYEYLDVTEIEECESLEE